MWGWHLLRWVSGVPDPQAYSCGWKQARAAEKSSSEMQKAGEARRKKLLDQLCKEGVEVALAFRQK